MPRPTRRRFLQSAAAASATIMPFFVRASTKSFSDNPIVGSGEFTYECQHNWDRAGLPAGHEYGNASHGVAIDSQGLIYITHQGNPGSIFVFDGEGKFVKAMGEVHNAGPAARGHGISIRKEGSEEFLYLAPSDTTMAFTKMTISGEVVWKKDRVTINSESDGVLANPKTGFRPTNISFRPDGGYYLGDGYGSHYVFEYDRNDKFVRALGGNGNETGKFSTPHGQWLDARDGVPRLVVADRANKRLQWFGMDGQHLKTLDGFLFPADIDVQGELMLVPDLHARITILNGKNEIVMQLGDDEAWRTQVLADNFAMRAKSTDWKSGRFVHPHDACFDADGNIYVTEWVKTGRVSKLVRKL
jgi:DNA-binding beta-propeller fold protein YncE